MFVNFFYMLRDKEIPVSPTSFLRLQKALGMGLVHSLEDFYIAAILCRLRNISLSEFRSACLDTDSKTIIHLQNGETVIVSLNDRSDLPDANKE